MAFKYIKRFLSLIIREMQIKATMKYHYSSIKTAKVKRPDNTKSG